MASQSMASLTEMTFVFVTFSESIVYVFRKLELLKLQLFFEALLF